MSHPAVPTRDAAATVLAELKAAGVAVEARAGKLRLSPATRVDAALRDRVAALKPAILSLVVLKLTPSEPPPARRGDLESPEEARLRQTAAIERLRLDREAFVEEAKRAGVYRGLATNAGEAVA